MIKSNEGFERQKKFYVLINEFYEETAIYSCPIKTDHSNYQLLIDMGKSIIPLLLHNLENYSPLGICLLRDIVGEFPFDTTGIEDKMYLLCEKWYEWGEINGYV